MRFLQRPGPSKPLSQWSESEQVAHLQQRLERAQTRIKNPERGCTIHEIMSVSGHLTMKEMERYTGMADRERNARAEMAGRV